LLPYAAGPHDGWRKAARVIRSEERSVPILESATMTVEGFVRVRRFGFGRGDWSVAMAQHEPTAVVVRRGEKAERIAIPKAASPNPLLMLIAMPIAARIATKLLTRR
jgi:hypothetical protein